MTPLALLSALSGLSQRETAEFLDVRIDTVKSWSSGRNACREEFLDELRGLVKKQERAAAEMLAQLARLRESQGAPDIIELGFPADDSEAQSLGWPCVGAWSAMAARVIAGCRAVQLVQRGTTLATAAAVDERAKVRR